MRLLSGLWLAGIVPVLSGQPLPAHTGKALVLVFIRTDCPIANRYAPELERLYKSYLPRGIDFRLVYVEPDVSKGQRDAHRREYAYTIPGIGDPRHRYVHLAHAQATPEAAVFVGERLVYHGRIDDRYADFGKTRTVAGKHDLENILTAVAAGKTLQPTETRAFGCAIGDLE